MKEQIEDLIKAKPKHFSQMIKRNEEMLAWVTAQTQQVTEEIALGERIYLSVNPDVKIHCPNGNKYKYKSLTEGMVFCGRAKQCQCCRESVSTNVSTSKGNVTKEQQETTNKKREATNLEKYGVVNAGQTEEAIEAHKIFYDDKTKVGEATVRNKQSKFEKYGDENYNNREQANKTVKERYGVKNPILLSTHNNHPGMDIVRDKARFTNLYKVKNKEELIEMLGVSVDTINRYSVYYGLRKKFQSSYEIEIIQYLREELGVSNIVSNSRSILKSRKELDIFLPDYNLAIEYNGLYWHHDEIPHITKSYHYDKFKECDELGIHLITIFSHLWDSKKELIKKRIIYKLGFSVDQRIFARQCVVERIQNNKLTDFFNENHIQGYCKNVISSYVLRYDGGIVAGMSFGKSRQGINAHSKDSDFYELVRFASNRCVVGGASRLFTAFLREYDPNLVISYSDNDYNTGATYSKLGFVLIKSISPSYSYFHSTTKTLEHRYKYAKHKLVEQGFDPNKTEREIMRERGFFRVWDCGNKVWHWTKE